VAVPFILVQLAGDANEWVNLVLTFAFDLNESECFSTGWEK
jgi:hypothetical protein